MSARSSAAHVHRAINAVATALAVSGVPRRGRNRHDGYDYRSIDDLLGALAPLLGKHRLNIYPRVLRRQEFDRPGSATLLCCVNLQVAFDLVSARDGSSVTIEAFGEAWDESDKATAKASTAAFKTAMFQTFCVPIDADDPDRVSPPRSSPVPEPEEGWSIWVQGMEKKIEGLDRCGLERLRHEHKAKLAQLGRARPDLYRELGRAFQREPSGAAVSQ